jgi:hypothetical protein
VNQGHECAPGMTEDFTTPHYDGHASVIVNLPAIDFAELAELIADSWRVKAPPKVLAAHEHELPGFS